MTALANNTAIRVALWRALHLEQDDKPFVIEDRVGLELIQPESGWQNRPDMSPFTRPFRASILARARFIEDLIEQFVQDGLEQYVILGAGLDTYAQRTAHANLNIFEIDEFETQNWKRQRLDELGLCPTSNVNFVPVDFEAGENWLQALQNTGFDPHQRALFASTGVSMYLSKEAIRTTLEQIAQLPKGTILVMSFLQPIDQVEESVRFGVQKAAEGAASHGTPWISFFIPQEILELARAAGFGHVEHISAAQLNDKYFVNRTDGLRMPLNSEELLIARV